MFKIKRPPVEPKEKQATDFTMSDFFFENQPVSEWMSIIQKHIEGMHSFDPMWDVQAVSLGHVFVDVEYDYDYSSLKVKVLIYETTESLRARHAQWEKDLREWEEWIYFHNDEIEAEKERRETEKLRKQQKTVNRAKQTALQEERKLLKMKGK